MRLPWTRRRRLRKLADTPTELKQVFTDLLVTLRDELHRTRRLMTSYESGGLSGPEREEAGLGARNLAVEGRIAFIYIEEWAEAPELFERYAPALRAASRLSYCLLALAGEDPEPLALISPDELETMLDDEDSDGMLPHLIKQLPPELHRE
jgi:hypothetical protein